MKDLVSKTLSHWRATSHEWGKSDCIISLSDYCRSVTGEDYAAEWRATYSTESEAFALRDRLGGMAAIIERAGFATTDRPERGDIVLASFGDIQAGGICTGQGVAFRRERGVVEINTRFVHIVQAWKVPQCAAAF